MKSLISSTFLFFVFTFQAQTVSSPSKLIAVEFKISNGNPAYSVTFKGKPIVKESLLGVKLKASTDLASRFSISDSKTIAVDETWHPVLGEESNIVNHYNQLTVSLIQQETNRKLNIVFRVFDEGVAFRYDFPKQADLNYFIISDEITQFNLTSDHKVFWLPGDFDSQEYPYNESKISEIDTQKPGVADAAIALKSVGGKYLVQSPLMLKTSNNIYLNIFEAAVVNYPVMHLDTDIQKCAFSAHLVPNAIGDKAYLQAPCVSP